MGNFMTDVPAMRDAAKRFHGFADNIHADAGKAWASANNIAGAGWDGTAQGASLDTMDELTRAFRKIEDMCSNTGDNLSRAADTYEQQEQANARQLGQH